MTHGGECSGGTVVKNVEGGVYSRGEYEISVRGGEAWYSGGRKRQGGEGRRGEKGCKPVRERSKNWEKVMTSVMDSP